MPSSPFVPRLDSRSGDLLLVWVAPRVRRMVYLDGHYVAGATPDPKIWLERAEQVRLAVIASDLRSR